MDREKGKAPAAPTSDELLRLVVEGATGFAVIALDPEGKVLGWNVGAERMLGWAEGEILGQDGDVIFTPEDRAAGAPESERRKALAEGRAENERWHVRKDGSRFWGSGLQMTLADPGAGFVKIMRDRTDSHLAEERRRALLAELHHRTRNLLAVVRAIARQTLREGGGWGDGGAVPAGSVREFEGRLQALSRAQDLLAHKVGSGVDLRELVQAELVAHAGDAPGKAMVEGPPVALPPEAVQAFALALHELATNAVKHGALGQPAGQLAVRWRVEEEGDGGAPRRVALEWRESGVAPPAGGGGDRPLARRGYGSELIERALPYQLGAEARLEFAEGGVRCRIAVPLPSGEAASRRG